MISLSGKKYAVFGIANEKSLAYEIAIKISASGGVVIAVCHPAMLSRVEKIVGEHGWSGPITCDVGIDTGDHSLDECFRRLAEVAPLDGTVHSIALSDRNELKGRFLDTTRQNFLKTMEISCFSLFEIARRSQSLMKDGGSIVTLSFDASQRTYPHYNVMGVAKAGLEAAVRYCATDLGEHNIRCNGICASPEDTLSARGIGNFRLIGDFAAAKSPLGRTATKEEIAHHALYLLSPLASGVTGQIQYVDCGSSCTEMPPARNASSMALAMGAVADAVAKKS